MKMEKLLKDISNWMNKYAGLLDNPQMSEEEISQVSEVFEVEPIFVEANPAFSFDFAITVYYDLRPEDLELEFDQKDLFYNLNTV